jgi:hypothetical protein
MDFLSKAPELNEALSTNQVAFKTTEGNRDFLNRRKQRKRRGIAAVFGDASLGKGL